MKNSKKPAKKAGRKPRAKKSRSKKIPTPTDNRDTSGPLFSGGNPEEGGGMLSRT